MSLILGVDLDGVVADFAARGNAFLSKQLHTAPAVVDQWNWYVNYGSEPHVEHAWKMMWHKFNEEGMYRECPEIPGAVPALRLLLDLGYDVQYITHRRESTYADTLYWLEVRGLDRPIHHISDKAKVYADLYIDDKPENVAALREKGRNAWLFDQPWNQGVKLPRLQNWLRFLSVVCEVEDRKWLNEDIALEDSLAAH